MTTTTSIAIIAIVAALGLLGVVAVTILTIPQQEAEARGCTSGKAAGTAINASKGRCFHP
jgi:Flp pilus assembly protein CpaB